jgi:hypothetical protein
MKTDRSPGPSGDGDDASPCRTVDDALDFVRRHGAVLVSARGAAPNLVAAIVGAPVEGSWWAHPQGRRIFALVTAVSESEDVLVCRLFDGKLTLVHRRLWPALVRLARHLSPQRLARVRQKHTTSGRHVNHETPFPEWVPTPVVAAAEGLTEQEAAAGFGGLLSFPFRRHA